VSPVLSYATARLFWIWASFGFSVAAFWYRKSASRQKPFRAISEPYAFSLLHAVPFVRPDEQAAVQAARAAITARATALR
jgi:hypothetical protein